MLRAGEAGPIARIGNEQRFRDSREAERIANSGYGPASHALNIYRAIH
jgi:hypothetical protein